MPVAAMLCLSCSLDCCWPCSRAAWRRLRLGVSTDTDQMFSDTLPWRRNAIQMNKDFPQFRGLLVAVIDAKEPEQADVDRRRAG